MLVGLYGAGQKLLAVVHDFTFLTRTSIGSDSFCTVLMYNLFSFPNFGRIFGVP